VFLLNGAMWDIARWVLPLHACMPRACNFKAVRVSGPLHCMHARLDFHHPLLLPSRLMSTQCIKKWQVLLHSQKFYTPSDS
jgi:hypothetical protein